MVIFMRMRKPSERLPEQRGLKVRFPAVQLVSMTLGLAVLVVISIIALPNLLEIYNAQKDFVVGSLFALVGFFFGKAFSRTHEQKALEVIRDKAAPTVVAALSREFDRTLHDRGAFKELSVLERNINAAVGRLLEYFDSQAAKLDFYRYSSPLAVAVDDLDHAAVNVVRLRNRLEGKEIVPESTTDTTIAAFASLHRDLHESNRRRIELYEYLKLQKDKYIDGDSWAIFSVMTSDILKAERTLALLRSGCLGGSPSEFMRQIVGYLTAALSRAEEFRKSASADSVEMPELFNIMSSDMHAALETISSLASRS